MAFICEECHRRANVAHSHLSGSYGPCELCGEWRECHECRCQFPASADKAPRTRTAYLQMHPGEIVDDVGARIPVEGTPLDAAGNALGGRTIVWAVKDPTIARMVNPTSPRTFSIPEPFVVECLAPGETEVTAICEGMVGTMAITVKAAP